MLIRRLLMLVTMLFAGVEVLLASTPQPAIIGDAYSLDQQRLLYREYHYFSESGLEHKVFYRSPAQALLAKKHIDYRTGFITPTIYQQSITTGEIIDVSWSQGQLHIRYFEQADAPLREARVKPKQLLVIDAGFDHFIRQQWSRLSKDERQEFDFPAPSRQMLVSLAIKQSRCETTETRLSQEEIICFTISPANWMLRWLVDSVELTYQRSTKQLLRYRGISNVPVLGSEIDRVDIRYRHGT